MEGGGVEGGLIVGLRLKIMLPQPSKAELYKFLEGSRRF